jgi:hypothetical protein
VALAFREIACADARAGPTRYGKEWFWPVMTMISVNLEIHDIYCRCPQTRTQVCWTAWIKKREPIGGLLPICRLVPIVILRM